MTKRLKIILLNICLLLSVFLIKDTDFVFARDMSDVWEISSDQVISDETIKFDNVTSQESVISITSDAVVTIENVTLEFGSGITDIDSLIHVGEGCTLELINVQIKCKNTQSVGILNNGILKLDNLQCENITKTIINNSMTGIQETVDSLQIYTIEHPISVSLQKNYISLYENTKISALITLDIATAYTDSLIGRVLVKGRNTLASFYSDYFYLSNTPKRSDYATDSQYLTYLQSNHPYMLDSVGDIGDDLNVADDGFSETTTITDGDNDITITPTNLETGDLIFTKFVVSLFKTGGNYIYVANKYCTADKFIEISGSTYSVTGTAIQNKTNTPLKEEVLNNYTVLRGSSTNVFSNKSDSAITSKCAVTLDVYAGGAKIDDMCRTINVIQGSSKSVFIDIDGYTFDNIASNKDSVKITSNISNNRFIRPIISCESGVASATITINLESNSAPSTNVDVVLDQTSFTYAKTDYITSIKPYYMHNLEKVELEDSEYTIYNSDDEECTSVINADTYRLVLNSADDSITFNNSEIVFVVSPKEITLDFNNEFTYDGNPKFVTAFVVGAEVDDVINITFTNNSRTLPGETTVGVSIDNANYSLHSDYSETILRINKISVDMSGVTYDDIILTYNGNNHEHQVSNLPTGVTVNYVIINKSDPAADNVQLIDVGEYEITANFSVDNNYYEALSITSMSANVTINRACIDTSVLHFDNITHVYDGNNIELIITDDLPVGIKRVDYTNNVQSQYSEEPYIATATFVIDEEYADNYYIYPLTLSATITIGRATADFSNFSYEDTFVTYDTYEHKIVATGYDGDVLNIDYLSQGYTDAGTYEQNISISLVDEYNYYPLTNEQKRMSATLTINKAKISTSSIIYNDVHHTYDGTAFTHIVSGTIPSEVETIVYTNNTHTNHSAEPYVAQAAFVLKESYSRNYTPYPSTMNANIYIDQAVIDLSNLKYEDLTIPYDGESHSIKVTGIDESKILVTLVSQSYSMVGEYQQEVQLSLIDSINYAPIPADKVRLTATLNIIRATINMTDVRYDNVAFTYDGTPHTHLAINVPANVNVRYENNTHTNVGQGEQSYYIAKVYFTVDEACYEPLTVTELTARITINRAIIDTSNIVYQSIVHTFDGNSVEAVINDELPEGIADIIYLNNIQSEYRETPYIARATFVISDDYADNYIISPAYLETTITIEKTRVDFSTFTYQNMSITYDGHSHIILANGYDSDILSVEYGDYDHVNAGTYTQNIRVILLDTENYQPLEDYEINRSAVLTINKAKIDTSNVVFEDVHHTYDGYTYVHTVSGEIPEEVERITYMNNHQNTYRSQPYVASATFILKSEYSANYEPYPSTIYANIYIDQAVIDFSNFKYEDLTVEYDGKSHQIPVTGLDYNKVRVTVLSSSYTDVGTYDQEIALTLRDNINFAPIPADKANIKAKLNIIKAKINMSGISFNDTEFTYSPNTPRKIEITGIVENLVTEYKYYDTNGILIDGYPIDSGVYEVQAYFSINGWSEDCYEPIPTKKAKLTINKRAIDLRYVKLEDETFVYDEKPHSLALQNIPNGVTYVYNNNLHTDVGNYRVTVDITCDTLNYYLINNTPLSATLYIVPAQINMSGVQFISKTYQYDKSPKTIEITGTLPKYVTIREYVGNTRTDAGTSNAYVSFDVSNSNYQLVPNMSAQLTITPRPITLSIKENTFTYTGNAITVEMLASGVLEGDSLNIQVSNASNSQAGVYYVTVNSLGNSNYNLQGSSSFRYEIKKANLDMTNIYLVTNDIVYDGQIHSPKLVGNLPAGLGYNIIGGNKLYAGEYNVVCQFSLTNNNYILPSPLSITMTIKPKPILVEFSNYSDLIADGNVKQIGIKLIGLIESNYNEYTIDFSKAPIEAGEYTCRVRLNNNSRYEIIGNDSINFEIKTGTKTYSDPIYDVVVEGGGFSADTNITIVDSDSDDVVETLSNHHVKKYKAFEINIDNEEENQEVTITLSIKSFSVENIKYLKLYKLESGRLKEIEYIRDNGKIKFIASTNDQIVLLEELNQVDKNQPWIYVIMAMSVVCVMFIISISIVYIMSKKKIK